MNVKLLQSCSTIGFGDLTPKNTHIVVVVSNILLIFIGNVLVSIAYYYVVSVVSLLSFIKKVLVNYNVFDQPQLLLELIKKSNC